MTNFSSISYRFFINRSHSRIMQAKSGIRNGDPISTYLFVITMEYLNRIMWKMPEIPNFNHHAKCEKIKITHLMFVGDLLMFSRGDYGKWKL